ncbi:hypothetical protein [Amycolatopsis jejuensis]|uniref:hypothetical protein n=1 Tax=Amycolatopsis jejuensis TaxID=330084 RepID=UPI0006923BFF|nr:hypothetical protein [Amycolatopsis jejuensis]
MRTAKFFTAATEWWTRVLGMPSCFDDPHCVGYAVHAVRAGMHPNGRAENGGGIRTALLRPPDGNLAGMLENPHFPAGSGPARPPRTCADCRIRAIPATVVTERE